MTPIRWELGWKLTFTHTWPRSTANVFSTASIEAHSVQHHVASNQTLAIDDVAAMSKQVSVAIRLNDESPTGVLVEAFDHAFETLLLIVTAALIVIDAFAVMTAVALVRKIVTFGTLLLIVTACCGCQPVKHVDSRSAFF